MTNFAGIDIETTGFEPGEHRIVEVYVGLWKLHNGQPKLITEFNGRINPQRGMPIDAQRVHKISANDLVGKPLFEHVANDIAAVMAKADVFVWHNGDDFDGPFLDYEFKRANLVMPKAPTVDTMKSGVWATFDGKKPNLRELCFACDVPYDPALAHAADYDVHKMVECYFRGLEWGFFANPAASAELAAVA